MLPLLAIPAILLILTALLGLINRLTLKLPMTIGLTLFALLASLGVMGLELLWPALGIGTQMRAVLNSIEFDRTVMQGLLCFLLFAGAMHVDLKSLLSRWPLILILASFGVLLSTILNALGFWGITNLFGYTLPFALCLVFGALIAPTDPVAVLSVLKRQKISPSLEAKIAGESLFNDGVAVVLFSILVSLAFGAEGHHGTEQLNISAGVMLFVKEAFGGALLGLVAGYIAYLGIRATNDYILDVIITLALVTGAYTLATLLHVSGPIAMVIAGLLIGNSHAALGLSPTARTHLNHFWEMLDEILNAILFLLIGFEIMLIDWNYTFLVIIGVSIVLVIASRAIAVGIPIMVLRPFQELSHGASVILTWAGLRGGISIALALSLPESPYRNLILAIAYGIVLFSIIVQGLTIERVIAHYKKN